MAVRAASRVVQACGWHGVRKCGMEGAWAGYVSAQGSRRLAQELNARVDYCLGRKALTSIWLSCFFPVLALKGIYHYWMFFPHGALSHVTEALLS